MAGHQTPSQFSPLGPADPTEVAGYRLQARLGSGGMGSVYLSYTRGGQPVALKVVRSEFAEDPEFRRRFEFEVRAARRVQGVYTVPVLDSNTEGAAPWLATAYVPGLSLADAVRAYGPLPLETVLLLAGGVAEALQSIHSAGIVHRDLKPGNVLLASDGPKVIDFGIARAADVTAMTGTDVRVGTPSYMAPEQITAGSAAPATDIFALGIVTCFAATGRHPFGEGAAHAVMYRIVQEDPDLSGAPEKLRGLIGACLAKDPSARPTPAEVIDACRALSPGQTLQRRESWLPTPVADEVTQRLTARPPVAPTPPSPPAPPAPPPPSVVPSPAKTPRRTAVLLAAAVVAGVAGGALAVWSAGDGPGNASQGGSEAGDDSTGTQSPDDADPDAPPEPGTSPDSDTEAGATPGADPDGPYRPARSDVEMPIRAPLFNEQTNVLLDDCYDADLTLVDLEELTVQTGVGYGSMDHRNHESGIQYMFCDDERIIKDGMSFSPELFVGTIDNPEPTAEECAEAAHAAPLPNPIPPEDVLRDHSLHADMGICVETGEGTVVLLWIDSVEQNPNNRDLRTYLTTATQWKPNE